MSVENKKKLLNIIELFNDFKNDTYGFQGECNYNQTEFESNSNKMLIGVHAPKRFIYVCFRILRYIIDDNWFLLDDDISMAKDEGQKLINYMSIMEDNCNDIISDNLEDIKCILSDKIVYTPNNLTTIYTPEMLYDIIQKKILNF